MEHSISNSDNNSNKDSDKFWPESYTEGFCIDPFLS